MIVVIDTNIIIASLSSKSKYHWIIEKLRNGYFELLLTNEILLEYEEKLDIKYGKTLTTAFFELLFNIKNVIFNEVYYKWNFINSDESDNKFIDCYISGHADYLITEDKHFNILKTIDFPKVKVINIKEFENLFL